MANTYFGELQFPVGDRTLVVSTYYTKGGVNPWTMGEEPRGYWVSFSLCKIEGGFRTSKPMEEGNFKVFARTAARLNRKIGERLADLIADRAEEEILPLYKNGEFQEIRRVIEEISEEV